MAEMSAFSPEPATNPPTGASPNTPISSLPTAASAENELGPSSKLQQVFSDLKVAILKINEKLRKRLIKLVRKNLDAFTASSIDFGTNTVVIHMIKTREAQPCRHKLRPIAFARRQKPGAKGGQTHPSSQCSLPTQMRVHTRREQSACLRNTGRCACATTIAT